MLSLGHKNGDIIRNHQPRATSASVTQGRFLCCESRPMLAFCVRIPALTSTPAVCLWRIRCGTAVSVHLSVCEEWVDVSEKTEDHMSTHRQCSLSASTVVHTTEQYITRDVRCTVCLLFGTHWYNSHKATCTRGC